MEIGAIEVALTNFPETALGLTNVIEIMKYNAMKLAEALEYVRLRRAGAEMGQLYKELAELRTWSSIWMYSFFTSLAINIVLALLIIRLILRLKRG